MTKTKEIGLATINAQIKKELANPEVVNTLIRTVFKGLDQKIMPLAMAEAYFRGKTLKDFLDKNVYAVPFGSGYSLVTSIDYARKVGAKNGVVDILEPIWKEEEGKIISCTVTVRKKIDDYIGSFSSTVYFDEYNSGRNQWAKMPHTMIAKVAEMASLRKACPEDLSQEYVEEEMQRGESAVTNGVPDEVRQKVLSAQNNDELKAVWDEHKGLGKEFAQMVTAQKQFLEQVEKDENGDTSSKTTK